MICAYSGCNNPSYVKEIEARTQIYICLYHSQMAIDILEEDLAERKKEHEIGYKESLLYPNGE